MRHTLSCIEIFDGSVKLRHNTTVTYPRLFQAAVCGSLTDVRDCLTGWGRVWISFIVMMLVMSVRKDKTLAGEPPTTFMAYVLFRMTTTNITEYSECPTCAVKVISEGATSINS